MHIEYKRRYSEKNFERGQSGNGDSWMEDDNDGNRASFKDMLLGESRSHPDAQEDDDFVLLEGDAIREIVDEIPSTHFSGRIHALIVKSIARTILSSY
ncbi:hypothetical protein GOBAR_DD30442 [Gossypium barbadense]|nr:hypothetical protein GOBAR_DD30442 [Gossypium barbadense]